MVKKFISIVFAMVAFFSVNNASAQEPVNNFNKNEFQIGVYAGARDCDKNAFGDFAKNYVNNKDDNNLFDFGVNYQYLRNVNNRLGVGAEANLGFSHANLENQKGDETGSLRQINASLMGVGRFYWIHKDHFGLYSKLALGAEATNKDVVLNEDFKKEQNVSDKALEGDQQVRFAVKGSPIGIDFGGKHIRGFVETNISTSVTVTAGAKFSF
ncbi:MAG: hypothetical protein MJZ02_06085 [Paludibacteraceae bacterium]|nr:hypothetical protein [Paludibacteraceae bacterium]